jgi:hypothetical protein
LCTAPLRDEDQRGYKVRDVADVQAASVPPIDEYFSDSTVGSDNEAPATSRRAPCKVAAPRCKQQTAGKIPTSQVATQAAEAKKRKQTRSAVSADTTTISSDVETIDVDDGEGDVESPKVTAALSPGKKVVETPQQASKTQERLASSTDPVGDLGSHKWVKKAPPKTCKPGLRSATK